MTAEFALVLPSVALMLAFCLTIGALQLQNLRLSAATSWAAREAATSLAEIDQRLLVRELTATARRIAAGDSMSLDLKTEGELVCAKGSMPVQPFWSGAKAFQLEQTFCARDRARP